MNTKQLPSSALTIRAEYIYINYNPLFAESNLKNRHIVAVITVRTDKTKKTKRKNNITRAALLRNVFLCLKISGFPSERTPTADNGTNTPLIYDTQ